jgi:prefoldin subunit 5
MVNIERVDLSSRNVILPSDRVGIVIAQPHLSLTPVEPYRCTTQAKPQELAMVSETLVVARAARHGASKTHFTIFPEYSIPWPDGIALVEASLQATDWPNGTIVIGGIDALSKLEFATLVNTPGTHLDATYNSLARVADSAWINCGITWVKAGDGTIERWLQPKLSPAWPERNVDYQNMFCGNSVFTFRGLLENGTQYRFCSLVCFDWIATVDNKKLWRWVLDDLQQQAVQAQAEISLSWMFVVQSNPKPSHDTFLTEVSSFFDQNTIPSVRRDRACLLFANSAGKAEPGKADTYGSTSLVFPPQTLFAQPDCSPTFSNGGLRFRSSTLLSAYRDFVFRERGACIHSFLQVNPNSLTAGAAGRTIALENAFVFPVGDMIDPRVPSDSVPSCIKWLNDELDVLSRLSVSYPLVPLTELVQARKQKEQTINAQITILNDERDTLNREIGQYSNSLADLGIIIEASISTPSEQLHARLNRVQEEIDELNQQIKEIDTAVSEARSVLTNAKNLLATKTAEVNNWKAAFARRQEEVSRLQNDSRTAQIPLEIDNDQLASYSRENLEALTISKNEAASSQTEVAQKRTEMSALRQELTAMKVQLQTLRAQIATFQRTVTQITARLQESKLSTDASEEVLLSLIAEESRRQAQLLALRDSISTLELAIDAETTAAALTTLQQNVRNKEKAIEAAARKRDQHQPWQGYFSKYSRLVAAQQNDAIANFTSEYGPRTSVIQRRLRSVYGFEDIEIQSRESTISVRVKRHGEELRPTDYFSQSQQQTLLLGLLLTACISQTWSGFAPVLMDDPVTHFDDLNTYAFLDLVVGLLESDFGRRQFIISTCDEKLLQLARQKFRHLGDKAAFYRFDAIGPEGPSVEKVTVY